LKKNEKETIETINKNHREQLKKLRKARKEQLKCLKENTKQDLTRVSAKDKSKGFYYWSGKYPEDHGDDYSGTIRRLELSVDNQLELNSFEFDSYIRNKWSWKDSFLTSNMDYVTSYALTGSWASASVSASYSGNVGLGTNTPGSLLDISMWGTGSLDRLRSF
jgi:hypothetical protein